MTSGSPAVGDIVEAGVEVGGRIDAGARSERFFLEGSIPDDMQALIVCV